MAYARFSDKKSNVYVYGGRDSLNCVACRLLPTQTWYDTFMTTSRRVMLEHLQEHRQRRSFVPWTATRRLKQEIRKYGNDYLAH